METETETFQNAYEAQWPQGYGENFVVYHQQIGLSESEIVAAGIIPFTNHDGVCLEVGCGKGFWIEHHLVPRFKTVVGVDVIRPEWVFQHDKVLYRQVPVGDYSLSKFKTNGFDFVWSFGCLCHLPLAGVHAYVASIYRVLKRGCYATLEFSESNRRGGKGTPRRAQRHDKPNWCINTEKETRRLLRKIGFVDYVDLFPNAKTLICTVRKP